MGLRCRRRQFESFPLSQGDENNKRRLTYRLSTAFFVQGFGSLADYFAPSLLGRESNGHQQNTGQRWPLTVL
jgi:hypothetical protein